MNRRKIIFISPDASLTGAPVLLLRFIQSLKKQGNFEIVFLFKKGGELCSSFADQGKVIILSPKNSKRKTVDRVLNKIGFSLFTAEKKLRKLILKETKSASIIFCNTLLSGELLKYIPLYGKRVFSYVHELDIITWRYTNPEEVKFLCTVSEWVYVPSEAVRYFIAERFVKNLSKIQKLDYIIPEPKNFNHVASESLIQKFTVGFCGTMHWRKGHDLVPQIIWEIVRSNNVQDIRFVWIGVGEHSFELKILMSDLTKMNLTEYFSFVEPRLGINEELQKINVLALPSREDAFPLVVLEAASYRVPTICFKESGGASEFIGDDGGISVDYMNIKGMAEAIIRLKSDNVLRNSLAERANEKVKVYFDETIPVNVFLKNVEAKQ